jgi:hypothetical protein
LPSGRETGAGVPGLNLEQECAALSGAAYHDGVNEPPPGWTSVAAAADTGLTDPNILRKLTKAVNAIKKGEATYAFDATLYYKKEADLFVLAFKGTTLTSFADWNANINQTNHSVSEYYVGANNLADDLSPLFADYVNRQTSGFWVTGHSLGGGLASAFAMESGFPAYTFNAAGIGLMSSFRGDKWPGSNGTNFIGTDKGDGKYITACYIPDEALTRIQRGDFDPIPVLNLRVRDLKLVRPGFPKPLPLDGLGGRNMFVLHGIDSVLIAEKVRTPPST